MAKRSISLRFRLILAFLLIAMVIGGASYYQLNAIQHFNSLVVSLVDSDFKRLTALEDINHISVKLRGQTFEYQHELTEGSSAEAADVKTNLLLQIENLKNTVQSYIDLTQKDQNTPVSQEINKQISIISNDVIEQSQSVITTASSNHLTSETQEDGLIAAQEKLDKALSDAIDAELKGIGSENKEIDTTISTLLVTVAGLAVFTTVLAVALGVIVAARLSQSLAKLKNGAVRIANGDFSHPIEVTSTDEIGQLGGALNQMAGRLKDSYRRLAAAQQRDEAMLQSMGEGVVAIDEMGRIILINQAAADILELDRVTIIGKPVQEAYTLYDVNDKESKPLPPEKRPILIALTTGEPVNDFYGFKKADGKKYILSAAAKAIKLEGGIIGAVILLRNVTKEREVDRMKTEFISLASHQLRTPLSAIKWFSEMLVSGDAGQLQADQLDFAKNIADSTERMIQLVNSLLNISRIESGRIMITPQPTDLKELVNGIINDLKGKTEEKKQTLIVSVHDEMPKVNVDPRLIGQVYLNLLTNAIKYTPKGGEISVFISLKDEDIISQVTDNGYGIPKEQQGRMFQKFFRASNAVKVETDGTGLGLYLIKAIIESSGGKIWFESEEGKGSSFWFSIPKTGMKAKEGEVTLDA